jgi:hypothetical protein
LVDVFQEGRTFKPAQPKARVTAGLFDDSVWLIVFSAARTADQTEATGDEESGWQTHNPT